MLYTEHDFHIIKCYAPTKHAEAGTKSLFYADDVNNVEKRYCHCHGCLKHKSVPRKSGYGIYNRETWNSKGISEL